MPSEYEKMDLKRGLDYIGVNCIFFCHDGKGNVLLHKRSNKCRDEHGTWDCGGGSMEFGETFEETVRRELQEEYLTEPLEIEYVRSRSILREHNGKKTHWIANLHFVLVDPEAIGISEPEKMEEIGWFAVDALPEPLHKGFQQDVELIKAYLSK